jgi:histidinol dehydrogenase
MTQRIRTTISISPDVLELFQRISDISGVSVSRCMGNWLADTKDGAEHIFNQMQNMKHASTGAIRDFHSRLQVEHVEKSSAPGQNNAALARSSDLEREVADFAPSSNTGLKSVRVSKKITRE